MILDAPWLKDPAARRVAGLLEGAGYQALFVGGCVRNALLGAPVSDLDISTDAHPDQVMELARAAGIKALPTGIDHGTVTVITDGIPFEITTFRTDVQTDGRHAVVAFARDVTQDAERRDFTMNALYCDIRGAVRDPIGGLPDLRARHLRFIGDPRARIREDYLRILRFFRFQAWYGRDGIDAEGLAACAELADGLAQIAKERIGAEMIKLLAAPDPAPAVAAMQQSGVLMRCLPGAEARGLSVLVHLEQTNGIEPDALRRLAMIGGQDAPQNLRLSRKDAKALAGLRAAMEGTDGPGALGYRMGAQVARDVIALRAASLSQPIAADDLAQAEHGAAQSLPIKAADLADRYQGAALGVALGKAEAAFIASDFTLRKKDLLNLD